MSTPTANGTTANGHRTTLDEFGPMPPTIKEAAATASRWLAPTEADPAEDPAHLAEQPPVHWAEARNADRRAELAHWWHQIAEQDLAMLLPKAAEYSAHDLRMTGHVLADMMGISVDDSFAAELACATYLMSKVTRILGAYKEGRLPAIDSITDARVYATMMARIRDTGGWPGWPDAGMTTS